MYWVALDISPKNLPECHRTLTVAKTTELFASALHTPCTRFCSCTQPIKCNTFDLWTHIKRERERESTHQGREREREIVHGPLVFEVIVLLFWNHQPQSIDESDGPIGSKWPLGCSSSMLCALDRFIATNDRPQNIINTK